MDKSILRKNLIQEIQRCDINEIESIFKPEYLENRLSKIESLVENLNSIVDFFKVNNVFDKQYFSNELEFNISTTYKDLSLSIEEKTSDYEKITVQDSLVSKFSNKQILPTLLLIDEYELEWKYEFLRKTVILKVLVEIRSKGKMTAEKLENLLKLLEIQIGEDKTFNVNGLEYNLDGESVATFQGLDHLSPKKREAYIKKMNEKLKKLNGNNPKRSTGLKDYL